jgi:hypothetical protein
MSSKPVPEKAPEAYSLWLWWGQYSAQFIFADPSPVIPDSCF